MATSKQTLMSRRDLSIEGRKAARESTTSQRVAGRSPDLGAVALVETSETERARKHGARRVVSRWLDRRKKATARAQRPTTRRLSAGDVIGGKYRLLGKAGEGAMGTVWEALNLALESRVAIKLLRTDSMFRVGEERLLREARAAAAVAHPGIVRVFDLGTTPCGHPYIVMELLEGESLGSALAREGRLSPARAVQLMLPVASAMQAAHAHGVIHRDLKPDNIMLTYVDGVCVQPRVVDFGIAKLLGGNRAANETGSVAIGTPQYMSPEQAFWGGDTVDHRSDIWSFCSMLYELISGNTPFAGTDTYVILGSILSEPVRSLAEEGFADPDLWAILERGLRKDAAERWESMNALGEALASWLLSRGVFEDASGASLKAQWLDRSMDRIDTPASQRAPAGAPTIPLRDRARFAAPPPVSSARPGTSEAYQPPCEGSVAMAPSQAAKPLSRLSARPPERAPVPDPVLVTGHETRSTFGVANSVRGVRSPVRRTGWNARSVAALTLAILASVAGLTIASRPLGSAQMPGAPLGVSASLSAGSAEIERLTAAPAPRIAAPPLPAAQPAATAHATSEPAPSPRHAVKVTDAVHRSAPSAARIDRGSRSASAKTEKATSRTLGGAVAGAALRDAGALPEMRDTGVASTAADRVIPAGDTGPAATDADPYAFPDQELPAPPAQIVEAK